MELIHLLIAVLASNSLSVIIMHLMNKKKNKVSNDNLIADTAEKLIKAAGDTVVNLTTRLTKLEEAYSILKQAAKDCEEREKTLNKRVSELELELKKNKLKLK